LANRIDNGLKNRAGVPDLRADRRPLGMHRIGQLL
jgi:hypothetical protein